MNSEYCYNVYPDLLVLARVSYCLPILVLNRDVQTCLRHSYVLSLLWDLYYPTMAQIETT